MAVHRRMTAAVRVALRLGLLSVGLAVAGCDAVQEDRTIEFSADAGSVGFQHGDQGVFVADKDGGGLKKVFEPGADVLATSTPLWSPKGRRLIFTTARAAEGDAAGPDRRRPRSGACCVAGPSPTRRATSSSRSPSSTPAGCGTRRRRAAGEAVRGEMRPRRLCGREPRRAVASPGRSDPLYRPRLERRPRPVRLRPEDENLAADLPARGPGARSSTGRPTASTSPACWAPRARRIRARSTTGSGSVSRMRTPQRGGTCRARTSCGRSGDRCWSSSAPPARPGRPMARSFAFVTLAQQRLRE